ncbi:hypothetical protein W02_36530 [Nitrospira sp. KM1]|uniref:hypothetical protein n=1 Tax=Nitrospira sp. KM1 TaxID=1936990 RepID=UPI0013A75DD7|nr:hypothetical protein [Nitrospira sp. KM1]BCA56513.1 hypothetical protein W02_36530 [Nitrospira sp. KM1]
MQLLFIHPNFPGQFGPLLSRLGRQPDLDCVFLSANASDLRAGVRCIKFTPRGGARQTTQFCSRTFENAVWSAHAVYEACEHTQLNPDVIIGRSGFRTTVFLQELYDCPIVCYGNDLGHIKTKTFREHVMQTGQPDVSRFRFLSTVSQARLWDLFPLRDLHIYPTVPFVLSWSLLNALACECTLLASNVAPVREVIEHECTGLFGDFCDVDAWLNKHSGYYAIEHNIASSVRRGARWSSARTLSTKTAAVSWAARPCDAKGTNGDV